MRIFGHFLRQNSLSVIVDHESWAKCYWRRKTESVYRTRAETAQLTPRQNHKPPISVWFQPHPARRSENIWRILSVTGCRKMFLTFHFSHSIRRTKHMRKNNAWILINKYITSWSSGPLSPAQKLFKQPGVDDDQKLPITIIFLPGEPRNPISNFQVKQSQKTQHSPFLSFQIHISAARGWMEFE